MGNKVLPLVFDESMSYYEALCKLKKLINDFIDTYEVMQSLGQSTTKTISQKVITDNLNTKLSVGNLGIREVGDTVEAKIDLNTGKLYVPTYPTVEPYVLPQATEDELGGIKAVAKGNNDTVEAKIDEETGKLYVPTYPDISEKQNKPITESFNITVANWINSSVIQPFNYYADVTISHTLSSNTVCELVNNQGISFGKFGFVIVEINGQTVRIGAVVKPTYAVTLSVDIYD